MHARITSACNYLHTCTIQEDRSYVPDDSFITTNSQESHNPDHGGYDQLDGENDLVRYMTSINLLYVVI